MLFNYDRVCAKEGVAEKETASMLRWCVIACDSVGIVNHAIMHRTRLVYSIRVSSCDLQGLKNSLKNGLCSS